MRYYYHVYVVKSGDNLTQIAKSFGYDNPGPIVAFPLNSCRFDNNSPNLIHPGEELFIPWNRNLLQKFISNTQSLIDKVGKTAKEVVSDLHKSEEEFKEFMMNIEAVNTILQIFTGVGMLVKGGLVHGGAWATAEIWKELGIWAGHTAADAANMAIPAPSLPSRGFKLYMRRALAATGPEFWASLGIAVKEKNLDFVLYGPEAVTNRVRERIQQHANDDISKLQPLLSDALAQFNASYYGHRISETKETLLSQPGANKKDIFGRR